MSLGLLGTTLLLIVAFKLPEHFPSPLISLPALLGTYLLAKGLQGSMVERHLEAGGKKASAWSAAAIGLLGCVLLFGGGVAWFFIDDQFFVQRVTFGADEEVIYEDGATEADARKIGIYLQTIGYFNGKGAKSVRVTCPRGRPRVEFVLQKAAANDPEIVTFFRNIQPNLSNDVFGGRPVEVQLVDEWWTVQRTLN
jgi:hypothetical protein